MNDTAENDFWTRLDELIARSEIVIDRPTGTAHPRFPEFVYPLDYGYLADTDGGDGNGVDVWVGSDPDRRLTAVVCTVDALKRDAEIKLLLGCTGEEARTVLRTLNSRYMSALLIRRI